ncbi:Origin recognition complex subunit 2 [Cytospora mali]|uniref:Origin recognition complex subunit 2 n=1 Tax=Cytospora mali TaxID=578113 RepID=A0A194VAB2_CYTMA|nr:Origin recognition complex subunit 2 [Valsa mali var. pyri (nom. inval.)]
MPRKAAASTNGPREARSTRSRSQPKKQVQHAEPEPEPEETAVQSTPSKRRKISTHAEPELENQEDGINKSAPENTIRADDVHEDELAEPTIPPAAPTPRKRGRPPKVLGTPSKANGVNGTAASTPKGSNIEYKAKFETPLKATGVNGTDTPGRRTIADRSARRKSARALIDRVVAGDTSDDEAGDEGLAREIYESSADEEDGQDGQGGQDGEAEDEIAAAATPSKRRRGRPRKEVARKKSPTPPRDLPPHEMYLFQNKPGLSKTSNNTLASLDLLTHDEYFSLLREFKDPHEADIKFLEDLHAESFGQWAFELAEGFTICLYGHGSKRPLLHRFAKQLHAKTSDHDTHKIVVINGYVHTISIREVLSTVSSAIDPSYKLTSGNPVALLQDVLTLLSTTDITLTIILNSADAPPLRRSSFQTILSQLASHPHIRLACSVDTPDFSLLWDSGQRSAFNFVFHDCTTFAPRSAAELEVVDEVHELLGRKARRVGGKDGVAFVLKSLPDNAKNLFRLLVSEVLVAMDDEGLGAGGENPGVEYRMLYNKAVEEFICSSEMAFRTLLKEFHDHQMITSRKDVLGTELLSLPFRKEELEAILEDLVT